MEKQFHATYATTQREIGRFSDNIDWQIGEVINPFTYLIFVAFVASLREKMPFLG